MEQIDGDSRAAHGASDDRLNRIRALLAQAENLGRPSEKVLDDIVAIIGMRGPEATSQDPPG
ncbi:MAG TPA: hypothetical protein VFF66_00560 [Brevundimonas sp.]|nr:hypothetical protein [Brevundimonas sp.]